MKYLALAAALMLASCTSETEYGDCLGLAEDKDPKLKYETDVGNVILAIIFSETIVVPAVVLLSETVCPVAKK